MHVVNISLDLIVGEWEELSLGCFLILGYVPYITLICLFSLARRPLRCLQKGES
jgi:hypothetical protein